jgi:hypothetical protein
MIYRIQEQNNKIFNMQVLKNHRANTTYHSNINIKKGETSHDSFNNLSNQTIIEVIKTQLRKNFLIFSQEEYIEKYEGIIKLIKLLKEKYFINDDLSIVLIQKQFEQLERELLLKDKLEQDLIQMETDNDKNLLMILKNKYQHANQPLLEKLFYELLQEKFN